MEALFTADIINRGENKSYQVFFENGQYVFYASDNATKTFGLSRTNDEWESTGITDEIARQQAIHAL